LASGYSCCALISENYWAECELKSSPQIKRIEETENPRKPPGFTRALFVRGDGELDRIYARIVALGKKVRDAKLRSSPP
jgi:hypothetical protein